MLLSTTIPTKSFLQNLMIFISDFTKFFNRAKLGRHFLNLQSHIYFIKSFVTTNKTELKQLLSLSNTVKNSCRVTGSVKILRLGPGTGTGSGSLSLRSAKSQWENLFLIFSTTVQLKKRWSGVSGSSSIYSVISQKVQLFEYPLIKWLTDWL